MKWLVGTAGEMLKWAGGGGEKVKWVGPGGEKADWMAGGYPSPPPPPGKRDNWGLSEGAVGGGGGEKVEWAGGAGRMCPAPRHLRPSWGPAARARTSPPVTSLTDKKFHEKLSADQEQTELFCKSYTENNLSLFYSVRKIMVQ
jgi:hypothetical protein